MRQKVSLTSQRRGSESSLLVCCRGVALKKKKRQKEKKKHERRYQRRAESQCLRHTHTHTHTARIDTSGIRETSKNNHQESTSSRKAMTFD